MIPSLRRPIAGPRAGRSQAEHVAQSPYATLEEFWDALADDTEAMSGEELRAELASFGYSQPKDVH